MTNARLRRILSATLVVLLATLLANGSTRLVVADGETTEAGTVISNRAEATYLDPEGMGFATVSPTVSVTVRSIAALVVTPDETEPSATVSPNERITRLFRVCNAGNIPDFYTINAASVSAPANIFALSFDADASGTLNDGDHAITLNETMSPRLARGQCIGVLAQVDTNASAVGARLNIGITARSNITDAIGGGAEDTGTIINTIGSGAHLSSPNDARLPPIKLVEERERITSAPGQTLNYTISFRNHGDVTAKNVRVNDDLPDGLEYITGTLKLGTPNARTLTDADDNDEGSYGNRRLAVRLEQVAIDELVSVSFQARIKSNVAPGQGIVNTAAISADNAPAINSSDAAAVVNPYGLVFEGRGGASAAIHGARVALLQDTGAGSLLPLNGAGSAPNDGNVNPFITDGQGHWSFVLTPAQLGAVGQATRYVLNVTAQGYRARMIEVTVTPAANGLFNLNVRALDGQPIAQAGSFELTENAVEIQHLAAFALNVPMFENSALEVTKNVDHPAAEIGDVLSYHVEVHNATAAEINDAIVRDVLPESFHYAEGTARIESPPDAPRNIEPEKTAVANELIFRVGRIAAGARVTLVYRVRVGANAREGDQVNSATASGTLASGETLNAPAARATVRIRRGVFSSQQIILGRVFDDANANNQFDKGERGLSGVRVYLNNGQSVLTDSAGLYTFPAVNEGAQVISLDPVTLPAGYALAEGGTRDTESWTRLLRSPLGGGALFRQNFLLRSTGGVSHVAATASGNASQNDSAKTTGQTPTSSSADAQHQTSPQFSTEQVVSDTNLTAEAARGDEARPKSNATTAKTNSANATSNAAAAPLASGTYEMASNVALEPVAPGAVRVLSPLQENAVVGGAALEIAARVNAAWTVAVEVEGHRVEDTKIGERRIDHRNELATFTFVGLNVRPGPNHVKVTAISPEGVAGQSVELIAYGRGPAKRLEIVSDKAELSAGGRDSTTVHVRAFDQWGHPAADASVALETSGGRLLPIVAADKQAGGVDVTNNANAGTNQNINGEAQEGAPVNSANQQVLQLVGGEGVARLIAENAPGALELHATTGTIDARQSVRVTPEVRPTILVGLAEMSVGRAAPELSLHDDDKSTQSRLAFFYRGQFLGSNLLTLSYDSNRPLNRAGGRDRLFQLDPLDRAYPLFGDSSTRFEDAQSNSKLYVRVDHGRSYFLFGDFESDNANAGLASYSRKLTGVKVHAENSHGDFVTVTGARPDTSFSRDVFAAGGVQLARLSHPDILQGSETVVLEVRDRRNPEVILSREPLARSVDYNLDATSGDIFFLRPISTFDSALNLVQVVVTYEHRADSMSAGVYTARAIKTFDGAGLRLGLSAVDQRQEDTGAFIIAGIDAEKKLPNGGRVRAEWAMSRGRTAFSGNLLSAGVDDRHDGNAYSVELEQPVPYKEAVVRARYTHADESFLNPFGATVTPGASRADVNVELKVRPSSRLRLGLTDERNHTANVSNSRQTGSLMWTENFSDRLRATVGYDFRRLKDDLDGKQTNSNLVTAGAEWQPTDKLQLAAKREQNLGDADPTYPDQTTLSATYQWNQFTRLFFTQRLSSSPITPISDAGATGFASISSRHETAIGIETRLGHNTELNTRYQLENGINGTDSFAVIGLQNRLPVNKELALDLGYERGFHLAGTGDSFNAAHFGFSWSPTENFRSTGRYELRDRGGLGTVLTLGAAGKLFDNLTTLGRVQFAHINFAGRDNSSMSATASIAWRPLDSDREGLLFSYTRRDLTQAAFEGHDETRDRADIISADGYYQASKQLELYGRFALKFSDTGTADLARVSTLTYMTQGRAVYRLGRRIDVAGETRWLMQPTTGTSRTSYGAELGYWALPDLRLGGGYNWSGAGEPSGSTIIAARRGFYFTISSKLSNLFDLFGTSREGLTTTGGASKQDAQTTTTAKEQP